MAKRPKLPAPVQSAAATEPVQEEATITDLEKPRLVSYTMAATISTGPYSNIIPTITVQAKSLEDAEGYVVPHINKLFAMFLNIQERSKRAEVSVVDAPVKRYPKGSVDSKPLDIVKDYPKDTVEMTPAAFQKASNAILNCTSMDALGLIETQIANSVKLTAAEKDKLAPLIIDRAFELSDSVSDEEGEDEVGPGKGENGDYSGMN